jgi:hypothetical protein
MPFSSGMYIICLSYNLVHVSVQLYFANPGVEFNFAVILFQFLPTACFLKSLSLVIISTWGASRIYTSEHSAWPWVRCDEDHFKLYSYVLLSIVAWQMPCLNLFVFLDGLFEKRGWGVRGRKKRHFFLFLAFVLFLSEAKKRDVD